MQILITGGAGFIGSTLADKMLNDGVKVIVIDNFNDFYNPELKEQNVAHNIENPDYKLYRGDICDKEFVQNVFEENKIDKVVHLAACAGVRPSLENPLGYVNSNIYGTVNILEIMKSNNVKKIVFGSSSSVYGNCSAEKFSEDLKISEPISPYAATKSACEQFIYTYSKLYDISAVCLRFFTVYGPRQRPDLAIRKFANLIADEKSVPVYGDGSALRDYTYIDDIISGVCAAVDYDKTPYEIINLGGGNPITVNQVINTLEKALGKTAKREYMPLQQGDVIKTVSDITKASKLLGYYPETGFEHGISKFIEWVKCNNAERKVTL